MPDFMTAVVLGATGLIGRELLEELLQDDSYNEIKILTRNPMKKADPKLNQQVVNFSDHLEFKNALLKVDSIFCCIGTTMKKVGGNKSLYREIDFAIPVNAAQWGQELGVRKFIFVSAVGARPDSRNFYLRLKGEVEKAVSEIPLESVLIMRPSLLLGNRQQPRPVETFARAVMGSLSKLLKGKLEKYRAIQAKSVARAMIASSKQDLRGVHIYEYGAMMELIQDQHRQEQPPI
jgi:uncharacterized protein YbjT (DUF2867 family)